MGSLLEDEKEQVRGMAGRTSQQEGQHGQWSVLGKDLPCLRNRKEASAAQVSGTKGRAEGGGAEARSHRPGGPQGGVRVYSKSRTMGSSMSVLRRQGQCLPWHLKPTLDAECRVDCGAWGQRGEQRRGRDAAAAGERRCRPGLWWWWARKWSRLGRFRIYFHNRIKRTW